MCHKTVTYPSDLTDEKWAIIVGLAVNKHWGLGSPMRLELRAVIKGVFYVLRTGCAWRYLPKEYPNHNSVYHHYHRVGF